MAVNKVAWEFNPFKMTGIKVPRNKQKEARVAVADFVKDTVIQKMDDSKSPVSGGRWKVPLTPIYRKIKLGITGVGRADLELTGDLKEDLEVIEKRGNTLSLQVQGENAGKADGNNRGTYGKARADLSKSRQFIPRGRQSLAKDIRGGISDILKGFK